MAGKSAFRDYLTVAEAAELLGYHPDSVRRICRDGGFAGAFQPGGRDWLIPKRAVDSRRDADAESGKHSRVKVRA